MRRDGLRWALVVLGAGLVLVLWPISTPVVMAAWGAGLLRPLMARMGRLTGGRRRAAGGLVTALTLAVVVPMGLAVWALGRGVVDLGRKIAESPSARAALVAVAEDGSNESPIAALDSPRKIVELVQEHGAQAFKMASGIVGAAGAVALGVFVFLYALYTFLVDGREQTRWLVAHAPLEVGLSVRFVRAFHETGRGLFVGVGLTGLAQGGVATVAYLALGVPRALVLGLLTCLVSVIPSVGTALVWGPVALGLALSGKTGSAIVLVAIGVVVIGSVDNVLRPVFVRLGRLSLSSFVLLLAMLGGVSALGPVGLFFGPLVVRLAVEALALYREAAAATRREARTASIENGTPDFRNG